MIEKHPQPSFTDNLDREMKLLAIQTQGQALRDSLVASIRDSKVTVFSEIPSVETPLSLFATASTRLAALIERENGNDLTWDSLARNLSVDIHGSILRGEHAPSKLINKGQEKSVAFHAIRSLARTRSSGRKPVENPLREAMIYPAHIEHQLHAAWEARPEFDHGQDKPNTDPAWAAIATTALGNSLNSVYATLHAAVYPNLK